MTKQKTDNLELILLDDVDTDAFFPDYQANLVAINAADKERQADIGTEVERAEGVETTLASEVTTHGTSIAAETAARIAGDATNATAITNEATARSTADATNAAAIASEASARAAALAALFVSGKIDPSLLPSIALDRPPFVVSSQVAMLALSAQIGDISKRTDIDSGAPFMLTTSDPTQVGNWLRLTGDYALTSDLTSEVTRATAAEATKRPEYATVYSNTAGTLALDTITVVDVSAGSLAYVLPTGVTAGHDVVVRRKAGGGTNILSVAPGGSETINGVTTAKKLELDDDVHTYTKDSASNWNVSGGYKSLPSLQKIFEPKVFYPEDFGAKADATTDDGPACSLTALAATAVGKTSAPAIVRFTIGKQYRIATSIVTQPNVTFEMSGAILAGPITGAAPITSTNTPTAPVSSDVAGQTAGGCFTDGGGSGTVYGLKFVGGRVQGFRWGMISTCLAWDHPIFQDVFYENCNVGFFAYQGAQETKMYGCYSGGGTPGTTFIGSATCFASDNPYTSLDNFFCDGFVYDNCGIGRDQSAVNTYFDSWFQSAILRASTTSVVQAGSYTFPFTGDSQKPSGRNIYIPSRNNRLVFNPTIRRAASQSCPLGVALIANPVLVSISNVLGENMFANGAKSMIYILAWNTGFSPTGTITNVDALYVTNTANAAVEVVASGVSSGNLYATECQGGLIGTGFFYQSPITPDVQVFTANGTWTKPSAATTVTAICVAGGAGGGSGRRGAASTVRCGGGGGGSGGLSRITMQASVLPSTVSVSVGAGGAGGAAQTTDSTDGSAGTAGSPSGFGAYIRASSSNGGGAGTSSTGTSGSGSIAQVSGSGGGAASTSGGPGNGGGSGSYAGAGASGAGVTSGDAVSAGGNGGTINTTTGSGGGTGGTSPGGAGGAGTAATAGTTTPGGGGAGGGSSITGAGGIGGAGGIYGGGGGGGGASLNSNASGAGGAGANGIVIVISQ